MAGNDWSRAEVEAIVEDYLSMLACELSGTQYNKAAHRRSLKSILDSRSDQAIEFKHANISAALLDAGFPYINGYKPRSNYQALLAEVVSERILGARTLHALAAADADRPIAVPEVDDILRTFVDKPIPRPSQPRTSEPKPPTVHLPTNYIEREARNQSLGDAGELFILNYERARLIHAGSDSLAARVEHTSKVKGDYAGYDILSYEVHGAERLIEVKTTQYGAQTPFFVSRNEVDTSARHATAYQIYRLFRFRAAPRFFALPGPIDQTCSLSAVSFMAKVRESA